MKSIGVGGDFSGQLAGGHILNVGVCPGKDACPHERSEAERQRQFEALTGIACSAGARRAFEHLLDQGNFNYKQLRLAWRQGSLEWDYDARELQPRISNFEYYGGWFMMIGCGLFALYGLALIALHGSAPWTVQDAADALKLLILGIVVPMSASYNVRPHSIARRVKPHLQEYYAQPH